MIEELKAKEKKINSELRRLQETRKALRKLIRYEEGAAPQAAPAVLKGKKTGHISSPGDQSRELKETAVAEPPEKPEDVKIEIKGDRSKVYEIPFEGHRFVYYQDDWVDRSGNKQKGQGWMPVRPENYKDIFEGCLLKVSDSEDLPVAKDGHSVFKVVEACKSGDTKVKVVVHKE
jgi:hypothetical protein